MQRDTTQSKYLANVNAKKAEKFEKATPDFIKKLLNRQPPPESSEKGESKEQEKEEKK